MGEYNSRCIWKIDDFVTYLDILPSLSPKLRIGDIIAALEDKLAVGSLTRSSLQDAEGNGFSVPVPLVIEEVKESVGVGVSWSFVRLLEGDADENDEWCIDAARWLLIQKMHLYFTFSVTWFLYCETKDLQTFYLEVGERPSVLDSDENIPVGLRWLLWAVCPRFGVALSISLSEELSKAEWGVRYESPPQTLPLSRLPQPFPNNREFCVGRKQNFT